ncbi:hypothetical protein RS030_162421 [Cryptosporidium xiaoi]|uniref:RSE1/DDB1/CPSF1 C-terminal domain-containing protein n=1 Tax=Cryptosporidium xiaoi TaxID=659607 RepID=A0AAV9Y073_9CRYT
MTAILDTYCRNERPEFSLFGKFVRKRDDLNDNGGGLDVALIKSDSLEIYEITVNNKIEYVTSCRLLLAPIASTTIKGVDGVTDYIALLFMNLEIMIYRYSTEYDELELVSKDRINIEDLLEGSCNTKCLTIVDMDENVKMEQIVFGNTLDSNSFSIMITFAKCLVLVTYKINLSGYYGQKLLLSLCWGISSETDLFIDTIIDSCLIHDEHSQMCLQPRIALLTRIGPVSNGSIQSHSNSSSLIYLNLNMRIPEFTVLEKLELLPMDAYKIIPIDTGKNLNNSLSGGVIILARSCILVHGGLQRPFTLVNVNDHYKNIPEKKLEIDICTGRIHSFNPKVFGIETGEITGGSLQVSSIGGNYTTSSVENNRASTDENVPHDSSTDLKNTLPSLRPILLDDSELSMDLDVLHSIPLIITNDYYGTLLFNKVQPYLILLVFEISNEKPSGISKYYWIKVNEYWDWNRNYLRSNDNKTLCLETTSYSKKINSGVSELDEHYLLTVIPIFPVQNCCIIPSKSNSETEDVLLCMVGEFSSNSGVSLLKFSLGSKFNLTFSKIGENKSSFNNLPNSDFNSFGYKYIVEMVKNMERNRDNKNNSLPSSGTKKTKNDFEPPSILDLEREYIKSNPNNKLNYIEENNMTNVCKKKSTVNFELLDYLDLGPCSLRDFCLIPNKESEDNSEFESEAEMNDQGNVCDNNTIKLSIDDNHSILTTNGSYPIGQLCLYMKCISKYTIAKFSLDDIIFHWVINDPFSGKTKYLVFTTDPLKSIGKTYIFSLENDNSETGENNGANNNQIIIGEVNQLDSSEGEYEFESDSNTVGAGIIRLGKKLLEDVYVVQILSSSINILDFELKKRVLEIDLISFLFSDRIDAPLAIKSFVMNNQIIVILFEDSSMKVLKFISNNDIYDIKGCNIKVFDSFTILLDDNLELINQLMELSRLNLTVINQRIGIGGDVSQRLDNFGEDDKNKFEDIFWIRHVSKMVSYDEKLYNETLLVLVVYSKLWLNGSLVIYDFESKRVIFFSPYVSLVPSLLGNIISPSNGYEDTIYRFLECEFDLGRPITCLSTPIIEPKLYSYDNNSLSISTCINFDCDLLSDEAQVHNSDNTQNSFLISSELVKLSTGCDMLLIVTVSQRPTLIYKLSVNCSNTLVDFDPHKNLGGSINSTNCEVNNPRFNLQEKILKGKWNLQIQPNCSNIQMDIRKFFPLFPKILTSENVIDAFSNESPLSTYNSGHVVLFSNNVDAWMFQPPTAINNEDVTNDNTNSQLEKRKYCSSVVILYNRKKVSIINFESKRSVNCIASINSPWSSTQILLTTNLNNEIKFRYLNIPQSISDDTETFNSGNFDHGTNENKNISGNEYLDKTLSTIPFLDKDNWFIRRTYLPEVVVQRVSYCRKYKLVALIVGIPDNAKHHLNGYHVRQMAFHRYLRCLEAGGKEGQAILMNQDLIRNPDKCFEKSLTSIPDLGIPYTSYDTETYFDTLPPGIEIGEILPKIMHQSNLTNQKRRNRLRNEESGYIPEKDGHYTKKDFEDEQFNDLLDVNILRNELLIFSMEDLFPQSRPVFSLFDSNMNDFPKPIGRFAFGAWEVGLSIKFGKDPKGQDVLIVGTGTNPTHYFEAEGRILMFKVRQLFSNNEDDRLKSNIDFSDLNGDNNMCQIGVRSGLVNNDNNDNYNGTNNNSTNSKWPNLLKYWPSKFSQELYYNNVPELEIYYSSMFRGPVTWVDLIDLPATTASIAPAIPALAAYPIIQNNQIVRVPTSNVTYLSHTFGYRLFIHELKENDAGFVKGSFMDTPLGITSVSNYKALFFLGDIRRGVHLGMFKTDVSRGSQTMVKLARSHPLWKFTCTSAHAIILDKEMAILVSDNKNNLFTFEPSFDSTQIIDKETLKPTSHTFINTTIVHMRAIKSGSENYVVASGRNGSFLLARLINENQRTKFYQLEKLLYSNIPSFLGISPGTIQVINNNQESIPDFVKGLYPTSKIFLLKHFDYIKYLSSPILKSIFKNSNFNFNGINQFIV